MPKSHTNPLVSACDKCDSSSPLVKRNDFCRSMESFRISSVSDVTWWGRPIIGSYETALSSLGTRRRVPPDESKGSQLAGITGSIDVNLTVPFEEMKVAPWVVGIGLAVVEWCDWNWRSPSG